MLFTHNHLSQKGSHTFIHRIFCAVNSFLSIILVSTTIVLGGNSFAVSEKSDSLFSVSAASYTSSESTVLSQSDTPSETGTSLLDPEGLGSPEINGSAYVLYDPQSSIFLLGKNQDTPLPPASITKVMTVLLAFERLKPEDMITVSREMYESIPSDYVRLGLVEGEVISVEDAIYSCLLISANDAAMALAINMGDSVEGFSKMMNERAAELGCLQTNFTNPYGFADENNLTTAHDMALILAEALKNEMYGKISTTSNYTISATNKFGEPRSLTNGNRFVATTTYAYEYYIGGKTGFTNLSGHTIVAGARQNDRELIGVILGAAYSEVRYSDLISLFNYGFDNYITSKVEVSEYSELQKQTVDQVTSGINDAGYALEITDVTIDLKNYCTTTSATAKSGYSTSIDISQAVIHADLAKQTLVFPLYRQYGDSSRDQVGSMSITICDAQSAITASEETSENIPKTSTSTLLIRAGIIFLLVAILTLVVLLFVRIHKEKVRKRSRRGPRVI